MYRNLGVANLRLFVASTRVLALHIPIDIGESGFILKEDEWMLLVGTNP